jgi:hypothetical protein
VSFDAVPVQYGWLGGHRVESGKFVAPEADGLPEAPLVSCLCVTENRSAFMPWLLWNFDKQDWVSRELVVVDSSTPPVELPERSDIRVIRVPTGTSLGKKRNIALEAARGAVIAWFDDDDWQHPKRLSKLVPLLRKCATRLGASFVGPSKSHFIDLHASRAEAYRMHRYAIFNGAVFYTHMVRHARFPEDVLRTEDTLWIQALLHDRQGAALVGNVPMFFLWLSHEVNVTNPRSKRQLPLKAESLIRALGSAWGDTPVQLSKLRARLARHPASRPVRVVQAEAECMAHARARDRATASGSLGATLPASANQPALSAPPTVVRSAVPVRASEPPRPIEILKEGTLKLAIASSIAVLIKVTLHRTDEWKGSEFIGLGNEDPARRDDAARLALAIPKDVSRADAYAVRGRRASLRRFFEATPGAEALMRHVLMRRLGGQSALIETDLLLFEPAWVARPDLCSHYVRNWLLPVRASLGNRYDRDLYSLLGGYAKDKRLLPSQRSPLVGMVLDVLPSIAFAVERRRVKILGQ